MRANLASGRSAVSDPMVWGPRIFGAPAGCLVRAIPGLGPSFGVALPIPFPHRLDPVAPIVGPIALGAAAEHGGAISAAPITLRGAVSPDAFGWIALAQECPTTVFVAKAQPLNDMNHPAAPPKENRGTITIGGVGLSNLGPAPTFSEADRLKGLGAPGDWRLKPCRPCARRTARRLSAHAGRGPRHQGGTGVRAGSGAAPGMAPRADRRGHGRRVPGGAFERAPHPRIAHPPDGGGAGRPPDRGAPAVRPLADPQGRGDGLRATIFAFRMSGGDVGVTAAPQPAGAQTSEILREQGLTATEIEAIRNSRRPSPS